MKKRCIKNGRMFLGTGIFEEHSLYILGENIVTEEAYRRANVTEEIIDADGCYVIPGLIDIHFHGCMGYDCCDGSIKALEEMARYELSCGVMSITPATMTMPEEKLLEVAKAAEAYDCPDGADFCGLYMEGPFINAKKKGAQKEEFVKKPNIDLYRRLQEASGRRFRTVAIAPETEGAQEFIREVSGEVRVSLAHTSADYETACRAFAEGASQITHLYNAMPPFGHRDPGPIGAAADCEGCRVELICDGIHIHPAVVRATFQIFGDDRIILISDSMRATGLPDGVSELGGQTVYKKGNRAALADGTIAGSVTNLMDCMRIAVRDMNIPLGSAVKCATANPAKAVHIYDKYGSLTPGKYANIVLLDKDLELKEIFHRGKRI